MTSADMLREIHADVREIRSKVDTLATSVAATQAAHEQRLADLEEHVAHSGPSRWDIGAIITALVAGIGAILGSPRGAGQ